MRRGRGFIKRIHRDRPEDAKFYRHRLLERGASLWLRYIMRERRPRQFDAGAFGLGRGRLRLGAADRGDAAFAARDPLRRLVQIADRAFAADRAVIGMLGLDAETGGELNFRIAVAPAQEIDDVERFDVDQQFAAAVRFRALERSDQKSEGLKAFGNLLRTIDDFADADDDGDAGLGDGGLRHFSGFTFGCKFGQVLFSVIASEAKQSISPQAKHGLLRRGACHRARVRATRWLLAMTGSTPPSARSCAPPPR